MAIVGFLCVASCGEGGPAQSAEAATELVGQWRRAAIEGDTSLAGQLVERIARSGEHAIAALSAEENRLKVSLDRVQFGELGFDGIIEAGDPRQARELSQRVGTMLSAARQMLEAARTAWLAGGSPPLPDWAIGTWRHAPSGNPVKDALLQGESWVVTAESWTERLASPPTEHQWPCRMSPQGTNQLQLLRRDGKLLVRTLARDGEHLMVGSPSDSSGDDALFRLARLPR